MAMKDDAELERLRQSLLSVTSAFKSDGLTELLKPIAATATFSKLEQDALREIQERISAAVAPEFARALQDASSILGGNGIAWAEVSSSFIESTYGSLEAFEQIKESHLRFQGGVVRLREALHDEPVPTGNVSAMARLYDYIEAACADPVIRQSATVHEIASLLQECIGDSSLRRPSWEKVFAPLIEEGSREKFAGHNHKRKSVAVREAFKDWIAKEGITVSKITELRDIPKASIPDDVFNYIYHNKPTAVSRAYNEVKKGTLKRGRPREKK